MKRRDIVKLSGAVVGSLASGSAEAWQRAQTGRKKNVIVMGAGIAGLLTATLLHRSGATVLVVDRNDVGGVATRNTTAKVTATMTQA